MMRREMNQNNEMDRLRRCARPVMFHTGNAVAPFAIKGTAFFVGYGKTTFVVTARHVVRDFEPRKLLFYPTEKSTYPVRITHSWRIEDSANEPDSSDLFLARTNFEHLPRKVRAKTSLIHLDPPDTAEWSPNRADALFFLCGYPSDRNEADYETSQANIAQAFLQGRYVGPGGANGTHVLRVDNPLSIDFDGLSGSPVFSLQSEVGAAASTLRFCGMAIRGGATSSLIQFLEAEVILLALKEAVTRA
jgi:hypothetical protein